MCANAAEDVLSVVAKGVENLILLAIMRREGVEQTGTVLLLNLSDLSRSLVTQSSANLKETEL